MKFRKSYCTTPGVGIGVVGGGGVSKKFNVKVFYVMGKALSGELSCPSDRSCCLSSHSGQLVKERICSCRSKFFSVRVGPRLEGFCCQGKQTEVTEVVSLEQQGKNGGKIWMRIHIPYDGLRGLFWDSIF